MTVVLFIVILGLLVFVHEFGHFYAAKKAGIGVLEFGFGFPPRLFGRKRGGTIFSVNLIPFGGFVRLEGESDPDLRTPTSFNSAPFSKKFIVLAAGVLMNYLLAWLIMSSVLITGVNIDPTEQPHDRWQKISQVRTETAVVVDMPAAQAGLRDGDQVLSINGQAYQTTEQLTAYTDSHGHPLLTVIIQRDNAAPRTITIAPRQPTPDNQLYYGFGLQTIGRLQYPWYVAPWYGLTGTIELTGQTFSGFGKLIGDLVTTGQVSEDISGPVGIAVITGQVSQLGFNAVMQFVAILSISLAVINFLPFPALDGGRAVFIIIEKFTNRRVRPQIEQAIHAVGFYLLILLIILISIRDLYRYEVFQRLWQAIRT